MPQKNPLSVPRTYPRSPRAEPIEIQDSIKSRNKENMIHSNNVYIFLSFLFETPHSSFSFHFHFIFISFSFQIHFHIHFSSFQFIHFIHLIEYRDSESETLYRAKEESKEAKARDKAKVF